MRCLRCGNKDPAYFYLDHKTWYCRKCIAFGRVNVNELPLRRGYEKKKHQCQYELKYPLTKYQKEVSKQIGFYLSHHQSILVYAVCGAGKTELVMEAIQTYLNQGKKVGFAISRRQVVLEIKERMQEAFSGLQVVAVCEGFSEVCDGDLIVCTMHQLYRYHQTFDLLIMDEVDAFPYRGNDILKHIAMHASVGEIIYLTATPDEEMLKECEIGNLVLVELFQRPHGYPLIEPDIKVCPKFLQILLLLKFLFEQKKRHIQTLVFVPTIQMAKQLQMSIRVLFRCAAFTSKTEGKEDIIRAFHEKKYECLITTTILERGITIKGIYIIVVQADHIVFNEASLTQIIGRVGRNIEMPTGKGVFLCSKKSRDIERCQRAIQRMNRR